MVVKTERERIAKMLAQIKQQIVNYTIDQHRCEGALLVLDKQIADDDALPKLTEV